MFIWKILYTLYEEERTINTKVKENKEGTTKKKQIQMNKKRKKIKSKSEKKKEREENN